MLLDHQPKLGKPFWRFENCYIVDRWKVQDKRWVVEQHLPDTYKPVRYTAYGIFFAHTKSQIYTLQVFLWRWESKIVLKKYWKVSEDPNALGK